MSPSISTTLPGNDQPVIIATLQLPDLAFSRDTPMACPEELCAGQSNGPQQVRRPSVLLHDAEAPIAIANAIGASFVRPKLFVGAFVARAYRHGLRRDGIRISADILDRIGVPIAPCDADKTRRFMDCARTIRASMGVS